MRGWLAGSTIAKVLAESNVKVDILEKRNHIAGIFDYINSNNERIVNMDTFASLRCEFKRTYLTGLQIGLHMNIKLSLLRWATTPINKITLEDIYGSVSRG